MAKDVHTEHCCIVHGCKYGDEDCTVVQKRHPQSYPCEDCGTDNIDPTKDDPTTRVYNFKEGCFYKFKNTENQNPALLYVMGFMNDENNTKMLIANIYLPSDFMISGTTDFVSSVQGVKGIKQSEWEQISKEVFEDLKVKYKKQFNFDPAKLG